MKTNIYFSVLSFIMSSFEKLLSVFWLWSSSDADGGFGTKLPVKIALTKHVSSIDIVWWFYLKTNINLAFHSKLICNLFLANFILFFLCISCSSRGKVSLTGFSAVLIFVLSFSRASAILRVTDSVLSDLTTNHPSWVSSLPKWFHILPLVSSDNHVAVSTWNLNINI